MGPTEINPRLLTWASDADPKTLLQAEKTARLPIISGHVALMPDAHVGIGATIGSVIPTNRAIIPAAVGVDIGCGMIAVETDLTADGLPDDLDKLHSWIAKVVPAGVGQGHQRRHSEPRALGALAKRQPEGLTSKQVTKLVTQFGSLGSGNHFVEVCLDERERVWVVLHSGSRGIGNELAQQHIETARGLMAQYFISLEDKDLAYLAQGTPEFDAYIEAMLWAQDYARANREQMMDEVLHQLWAAIGVKNDDSAHVGKEVRRINCHHNFTEMEHHHGKDLWITRKGAIRARVGDEGVIPGSMGTRSYIVSGLGNPASYNSCSHGAGRRMSRSQAKKLLTVESLTDRMEGKAWNRSEATALLDEHPDAYKDIDQVMADQRDLVEVVHELHQILNYKGAK